MKDLPTLSATTLAVLAGGAGSRMGGPKSHLHLAGKPILQRFIDRIQWPGPTMLVTAPGIPTPASSRYFTETVCDPVSGLGPLRGVLTALEQSRTPTLCIATVDMPMIRREMLQFLIVAMESRPNVLGMMFQIAAPAQEIEPFPSVFRMGAKNVIRQRLELGRRSVRSLCDDALFITVPSPCDWPADVWTNLNTPADLAAFEQLQDPG